METCFFLTGGFNQWAKKAFENWHGCVFNPLLIYHFHGKAARFSRSIHIFCNYIYPRVSLILGHQEAEHSGGKHVWINCSFSFGDMDTKKHSRCFFFKVNFRPIINQKVDVLHWLPINKRISGLQPWQWVYTFWVYSVDRFENCYPTHSQCFFWNYNHYIT